MFFQKQDLYLFILQDELHEITRGDDILIDTAIAAALSEVKAYLNDSFEVDTIFAQTNDDRNHLLVKVIAEVALYAIVARCQAGQELEDRRQRYDRAIKILKALQQNELFSELPRRITTQQVHILHGSNPKRKNYF